MVAAKIAVNAPINANGNNRGLAARRTAGRGIRGDHVHAGGDIVALDQCADGCRAFHLRHVARTVERELGANWPNRTDHHSETGIHSSPWELKRRPHRRLAACAKLQQSVCGCQTPIPKIADRTERQTPSLSPGKSKVRRRDWPKERFSRRPRRADVSRSS